MLRLRHPNIVKLDSVIRHSNQLYLVFEHMERNLYELMQANGKIDATRVRNFMFQILQGVNYIHTRGYFHRDLKPGKEADTKPPIFYFYIFANLPICTQKIY